MPEIAKAQGVNVSTVWRFLETTNEERRAVSQYVSGRTEVFQKLQCLSLDLQQRILTRFSNGILDAMEPHQMGNLLDRVNTVFGTIYDKERLESGKSTQNVGIVARMMGEAVKTAHAEVKDIKELEEK